MYFFYYNPNNNPNDITFLLNSRLFLPLLQSHDVPLHIAIRMKNTKMRACGWRIEKYFIAYNTNEPRHRKPF